MEKRRGKARGRLLTRRHGSVLQWQWVLINPFMEADLVHGSVYIEDGKEKAQVEQSKRN